MYKNCLFPLLMLLCLLTASCKKKKQEPAPTSVSSVSVDKSFGVEGRVLLPGIEFKKLDLLSDGKIVLSEDVNDYGTTFSAVKFYENGTSDNAFGTWGKLDLGTDITRIAVQSDGKIWKFFLDPNFTFTSERFYAHGPSEFLLTGTNSFCNTVQLPDLRVLVFNTSAQRLNLNGVLDNTFANAGISDDLGASALEVQYYKNNVYVHVAAGGLVLKKMSEEGQLDNTFGSSGSLVTQELDATNYHYRIFNDKLYVYYSYSDNTQNTHGTKIKRYHLNGQPDAGFGTNGEVRIPPVEYLQADHVKGLVVSENGEIYVFVSHYGNEFKTFLYKLNSDGQRTTTFGENGQITLGVFRIAMDMKIKGKNIYLLGTEKSTTQTSPTGSSILMKYQID